MQWIKIDQIIFDRYKIVERLGAGGQSLVYKAEDISLKYKPAWMKTVFIKQYTDLTPPETEFERIETHFSSISYKLSEIKNFICLPAHLGVCSKHGSIIAVFPFITGKRLSEKLKEGLHHDERVRIAFAIINTARKIHEQEIAHLDIKPDNIVVYNSIRDDKIYIQVIDLDGSKIDGVGLRPNVIKTIGYGSPEHFVKDGNSFTSIKSDIFSLGIVLLELLTGVYPFPSINTCLALAENKEITVGAVQIHGDIIRTLISCLDFDPEKRPTAGKILSIFNRHHDNKLLALTEKEKWDKTKKNISVSVSLYNESISFKRVYYENKIFTSQDLKGSGLKTNSGELFAFIFENEGCYLIPLTRKINFEIGEYQLSLNKPYQLFTNQKINIEDSCFEIEITYF